MLLSSLAPPSAPPPAPAGTDGLLHAFFDGGMAHAGATTVHRFGLMDSDRHGHATGYSGQAQAVEDLQGKQEFACV